MVLANIVKLDGETIGGGLQFVLGQQQRRGIALLAPPAEHRLGGAQFDGRDFCKHAENVVVGKLFVVVAGGRGTVEDDGDQAWNRAPCGVFRRSGRDYLPFVP